VTVAAIGGGWGLIVGLVAGAIQGGDGRGLARRLAAAAAGAVGGMLTGLIGGGLGPFLVEALRPWLPAEASSALGWAFAGLLAGLVSYGWVRAWEGPRTAWAEVEVPGEVGAPGEEMPAGEGWPRAVVAAAGWAAGGAVSAAGAWLVGLVAVYFFLGIGPLIRALKDQPADAAVVLAGFGGGSGLLVGAAAGLMRGRGGRVAAAAAGGGGGALTGLIGGGLAPVLVAALRESLPPEASSALGWAFAGLLAGLVAYGWTRGTPAAGWAVRSRDRRTREVEQLPVEEYEEQD
jgi:hypothetical protein